MEGVDRNTSYQPRSAKVILVALLMEGVDRNSLIFRPPILHKVVALLMEGVDRNRCSCASLQRSRLSPSSWRAWIEIALRPYHGGPSSVALLMEGVDRNAARNFHPELPAEVALLMEGVDRNTSDRSADQRTSQSPSSWRAWIEIRSAHHTAATCASPSSWRAWIEIFSSSSSLRMNPSRPPHGGRG